MIDLSISSKSFSSSYKYVRAVLESTWCWNACGFFVCSGHTLMCATGHAFWGEEKLKKTNGVYI
jgi:hypothetical protein